jgi:hypothetical protein
MESAGWLQEAPEWRGATAVQQTPERREDAGGRDADWPLAATFFGVVMVLYSVTAWALYIIVGEMV